MIQIISLTFAIVILSTFSFKSKAQIVKIMSYNVENLFDITHDQDKNDYTYLPLKVKKASSEVQQFCSSMTNAYYQISCYKLDWSQEVLNKKLKNISKVIKTQNPDILILQEVENINVLEMLVENGLKDLGYKNIILIEGPDSRGIDIGILSKFKLARKSKLHYVNTPSVDNNGNADKETRGILEASFKVNGKIITIFGNHWPSQSHPDQSRLEAGKTLYNAINPNDDLIISAGDFNTVVDNLESGIDEYLLNPSKEYLFIDAEAQFFKLNPNSNSQRGTHYHRGNWGSLDHLFVLNRSKKILSKWNSFQVVKEDFMVKKNKKNHMIPFRFDAKAKNGYSDHLPVVMSFDL